MASALPAVSSPLPGDVRQFLDVVRSYLDANPSGGVASLKSALINGGVVVATPAGLVPSPAPLDYTAPGAVSGFTAGAGGMTDITLSWAALGGGNVAWYEIWRGAHGGAIGDGTFVQIGSTVATVYSDPVAEGASYDYWIRAHSKAGVAGAWNATGGTFGWTSQNPTYLMSTLTGGANLPFVVTTTDTVVNGVTVPAGTYIANAFISNGAIGNAQIGTLAVDNAKIAGMAVDKLAAGALAVGQYIQSTDYVANVSGWRVNANGQAEFQNVSVRGDVQATSGSITGATVTGGVLQTATSGQRIQMDSQGMLFLTGATPGGKYGSFKYGAKKYGTGVLVYFNNAARVIPFYVQSEQTVADMHLYNRAADPTGAAEIGDLAVVGGKLKICTVAGTPGTWTVVGTQT